MRRIFVIILVVLVLAGAAGAYWYMHTKKEKPAEAVELPQAFETMTFGSYGGTPISWYVLKHEDGNTLLLSAEILDYQPYNTERTDITWADCSLRSWLNSTFLMEAFTPEEQSRLVEAHHSNSDEGCPKYAADCGTSTVDKVFLLSYSEAWDCIENNVSRVSSLSAAAKEKDTEKFGAWWWLRSNGYYSYTGGGVSTDGTVDSRYVEIARGVRPAILLSESAD